MVETVYLTEWMLKQEQKWNLKIPHKNEWAKFDYKKQNISQSIIDRKAHFE